MYFGRFPLTITVSTSYVNFWLHIIQFDSDYLISIAYLEQVDNGINDKSLWTQFIRNLLCESGFSHVWSNHYTFTSSALLSSIKSKLQKATFLLGTKVWHLRKGRKKTYIMKTKL